MQKHAAKPTLYLMLGFPGAGKTTTSQVLSSLTGAVHLSSDMFRLQMFPEPAFTQHEHDVLYRTLNYLTELLLLDGISVIYDANLNRRVHRQEKYDLAKRLDLHCELLWVSVSEQTAKQRALTVEDLALRPFGTMPEHMFDRIASVFEEPVPQHEPYTELDGTAITPDYVRSRLHLNG